MPLAAPFAATARRTPGSPQARRWRPSRTRRGTDLRRAARAGWRKGADAGNAADLVLHFRHDLEDGAFAFAPGFEHQPGKPVVRKGDLERLSSPPAGQHFAVDGFGVKRGLVNRRIRRRLDDAHHDALVFCGREFFGRHHEHAGSPAGPGPSRRYKPPDGPRASRPARGHRPDGGDRTAVDPPGEAVLLAPGVEQLGRHDRRKGEGDHAGNKHRAGQGEGEFPEQRPGEAACKPSGIHGGERDRHGNDGTEQFARPQQRRVPG